MKANLINLLQKNYKHVIKSEEEATLVLNEISEVVVESELEEFIKNDLCVFGNKKYAFKWFFDEEGEGVIDLDSIDFDVEQYMVGKNILDILLESKENYIEVNENIHLTYWLC